MKYLPFLLLLSACSFESKNLEQNITESQATPTSHSTYLDTRKIEPEYEFEWSDRLSRINDSSIVPVIELLENRYDEEFPDFALLDWNNDGYEDLFFEYYASAGTGIKFRVDVYQFDPKTNKFSEKDYSFMNPSFYFDRGIITSHYWGNGGGYGEKYKVHNGIIDTLEKIDIDILPYRPGPIKEVNYTYSQHPFKDSIYVSDTLVQLPLEYTYRKIIEN
ncbi:MAG: hypothetical protein ABJG68_07345 [Crocinitomicaceae bacterium]